MTTSRLKSDGKPMRALRVLASASKPMLEQQVHAEAKVSFTDTTYFHGALRTLVSYGFARVKGPRGGQEYAITNSGRAYLKKREEGSGV